MTAERDPDNCSPRSNPHSDQPNWRSAEPIDDYLSNCREGLEIYTDSRAAKLMGWTRMNVYRAKLMAELPEDLFEYLLDHGVHGPKALSQIALALRRGGRNIAEVERCPHCGEVLRIRGLLSNKVVEIVNRWLDQNRDSAP